MERPTTIVTSVRIHAGDTRPRMNCDHTDGTTSIALCDILDRDSIYLNGTLDELAKFVADLASVVRELTERELQVTA